MAFSSSGYFTRQSDELEASHFPTRMYAATAPDRRMISKAIHTQEKEQFFELLSKRRKKTKVL